MGDIDSFLKNRPSVEGAYGYGSGVFKQKGYNSDDKPLIDLILVVNDSKKWHEQNKEINPTDYSGVGKVCHNSFQSCGGRINYQTFIFHKEQQFKYGIIEKDNFISSLEDWSTFYVAGRFQKPILSLKTNRELDRAIDINRYNALILSLFLIDDDKHDLMDLYKQIVSLSYLGDNRNGIAENPHKIDNIVLGNYDKFKNIYNLDMVGFYSNDDNFLIQRNDLIYNTVLLPKEINSLIDIDLILRDKSELDVCRKKVLKYLSNKNNYETWVQTLKGSINNGLGRSKKYLMEKRKKLRK